MYWIRQLWEVVEAKCKHNGGRGVEGTQYAAHYSACMIHLMKAKAAFRSRSHESRRSQDLVSGIFHPSVCCEWPEQITHSFITCFRSEGGHTSRFIRQKNTIWPTWNLIRVFFFPFLHYNQATHFSRTHRHTRAHPSFGWFSVKINKWIHKKNPIFFNLLCLEFEIFVLCLNTSLTYSSPHLLRCWFTCSCPAKGVTVAALSRRCLFNGHWQGAQDSV